MNQSTREEAMREVKLEWFYRWYNYPGVFASAWKGYEALSQYPRLIDDDDFPEVTSESGFMFKRSGAYVAAIRECIENGVVVFPMPEGKITDSEPGDDIELYAWIYGFVMTEKNLKKFEDMVEGVMD